MPFAQDADRADDVRYDGDDSADCDSGDEYIEFYSTDLNVLLMYNELRTCFDSSEVDVVPPTKHATVNVIEILEEVSSIMLEQWKPAADAWKFPAGFISTDHKGGIQVEWWKGQQHCVILSIGHSPDAPTFVLSKLDPTLPGTTQSPVHAKILASLLHDLNLKQSGPV